MLPTTIIFWQLILWLVELQQKITGVSSSGVLTYNGGNIDPNVGTDYQRVGGG